MSSRARARPRRVGHKGAAHIEPGNTLASFDAALRARRGHDRARRAQRARPTASGRLLVAHDYEDLRSRAPLDASSRRSSTSRASAFAGDRARRRREAARLRAARARRAARAELIERTLISGMFPAALDAIRAAEPALRLGWSVPRVRRDYTTDMLTAIPALAMLTGYRATLPRRARAALRQGRFDAIMAHWRVVTRALVRAVAEGGGELYVWTVDDAALIERLTAMGVDGIITNDPRLFSRSAQRCAALNRPGRRPARLLCARAWSAARPTSSDRAAAAPLEAHDAAQRRTAACRRRATSWKLRPPWRAERRVPDVRRTPRVARWRGPPSVCRGVQVLQAEAHVHLVVGVAVAGHRAADADVLGWSRRVADVDRGPQFRASAAARSCAARFARARAAGATPRTARSACGRRAEHARDSAQLRAASEHSRSSDSPARSRRAAAAAPAPGSLRPVVFPARWRLPAQPRSSSCSGACRCSRRSSTATWSGSPRWRCRAPSSPAQVGVPRGRRQRHLLRRARGPRARDPHARRRAHDHARDVRPRRHLRRAGDVRGRAALGDRRGDRARRAWWRCSGPTCAG